MHKEEGFSDPCSGSKRPAGSCRVCLLDMTRYDGTVRNAVGDVIQFLYGEDGMDGAAIESQKVEALKATEVQLGVRILPVLLCKEMGSTCW
jgi:hypothetical protein